MNQELTILLNLCTGKHVEASPFRGITNQRRSLAPYRQNVLRENYALSILSSTAASLLIVIAAFKLWPVRTNQVDFVVASADHSRELVLLDDVRPTRQSTIHIPPAIGTMDCKLIPGAPQLGGYTCGMFDEGGGHFYHIDTNELYRYAAGH